MFLLVACEWLIVLVEVSMDTAENVLLTGQKIIISLGIF